MICKHNETPQLSSLSLPGHIAEELPFIISQTFNGDIGWSIKSLVLIESLGLGDVFN